MTEARAQIPPQTPITMEQKKINAFHEFIKATAGKAVTKERMMAEYKKSGHLGKNALDTEGNTPLMTAARAGNLAAVKFLCIDSGKDPAVLLQNKNNEFALSLAVQFHDPHEDQGTTQQPASKGDEKKSGTESKSQHQNNVVPLEEKREILRIIFDTTQKKNPLAEAFYTSTSDYFRLLEERGHRFEEPGKAAILIEIFKGPAAIYYFTREQAIRHNNARFLQTYVAICGRWNGSKELQAANSEEIRTYVSTIKHSKLDDTNTLIKWALSKDLKEFYSGSFPGIRPNWPSQHKPIDYTWKDETGTSQPFFHQIIRSENIEAAALHLQHNLCEIYSESVYVYIVACMKKGQLRYEIANQFLDLLLNNNNKDNKHKRLDSPGNWEVIYQDILTCVKENMININQANNLINKLMQGFPDWNINLPNYDAIFKNIKTVPLQANDVVKHIQMFGQLVYVSDRILRNILTEYKLEKSDQLSFFQAAVSQQEQCYDVPFLQELLLNHPIEFAQLYIAKHVYLQKTYTALCNAIVENKAEYISQYNKEPDLNRALSKGDADFIISSICLGHPYDAFGAPCELKSDKTSPEKRTRITSFINALHYIFLIEDPKKESDPEYMKNQAIAMLRQLGPIDQEKVLTLAQKKWKHLEDTILALRDTLDLNSNTTASSHALSTEQPVAALPPQPAAPSDNQELKPLTPEEVKQARKAQPGQHPAFNPSAIILDDEPALNHPSAAPQPSTPESKNADEGLADFSEKKKHIPERGERDNTQKSDQQAIIGENSSTLLEGISRTAPLSLESSHHSPEGQPADFKTIPQTPTSQPTSPTLLQQQTDHNLLQPGASVATCSIFQAPPASSPLVHLEGQTSQDITPGEAKRGESDILAAPAQQAATSTTFLLCSSSFSREIQRRQHMLALLGDHELWQTPEDLQTAAGLAQMLAKNFAAEANNKMGSSLRLQRR